MLACASGCLVRPWSCARASERGEERYRATTSEISRAPLHVCGTLPASRYLWHTRARTHTRPISWCVCPHDQWCVREHTPRPEVGLTADRHDRLSPHGQAHRPHMPAGSWVAVRGELRLCGDKFGSGSELPWLGDCVVRALGLPHPAPPATQAVMHRSWWHNDTLAPAAVVVGQSRPRHSAHQCGQRVRRARPLLPAP